MNITYLHIYYCFMAIMFISLLVVTLAMYLMFIYTVQYLFWFNTNQNESLKLVLYNLESGNHSSV